MMIISKIQNQEMIIARQCIERNVPRSIFIVNGKYCVFTFHQQSLKNNLGNVNIIAVLEFESFFKATC